jgi:hypothetical protein
MTKNRNWLYFVGITLQAIVFVLIFTGCMKEPDFEQDFGDEVAAQEIDKVLNDIYDSTASPYDIKKGEFSYLERTQEIESFPPILLLQKADTVTNRVDTPNEIVFTIVSEIRELIDGQMKPSREEREVPLRKPTTPSPMAAGDTPAEGPPGAVNEKQLLSWKSIRQQDVQTKARVTYHRLTKKDDFIQVPPLVQTHPNCGGLGTHDCFAPLPVSILRFDRVDWEGETGSKTSYLFVFSPKVPYFASQLLGCAETTVPYEGQRVKLRQCDEVKDFIFGSDTF